MTIFVEIAVNVSQISKSFHYHLPSALEGQIEIGHLVTVPFGRQIVQGVVLDSVSDPTVAKTKPILELLDPDPVLTPAQIQLAYDLAKRSLTPLAACISLMLPPGLSQAADTLYQAGITKEQMLTATRQGSLNISDAQWRLLTLLIDRGPLRGRQIDRALPRKNWQATAEALKRRGLVTTQPVLQAPTVKPKVIRTAQLACTPELAKKQMKQVGREGSAAQSRRQAILHFLIRETGPVDVSWVYAHSGGNLSDLKKLAQMGLIFLGESETVRDPLDHIDYLPSSPPDLTKEQVLVWQEIKNGIQKTAIGQNVPPYLLYGVTGSGKTEIYLHALEATIQLGKSAIILVPEIALTPQTVRRFISRFPEQIGLVHSKLSPGERYDTWRRARSGLLSAVVGPRSALFTPFSDIGLIVVDECHDQSYYQTETPPSYHAREVAVAYAQLVGAVCILGSATPDIVSTYRASQGKWIALSLPERILAHKEAVRWQMKNIQSPKQTEKPLMKGVFRPLEKDAETTELPPVQVVDMREELKAGNRSIFSIPLQIALKNVLDNEQQAILFINRRGMATYVFCRDCGQAIKCPRCDIPLTYHLNTSRNKETSASPVRGIMVCHRCYYQRQLPKTCPVCGSTRIKQYGTGTERVEQEIQSQFPHASTVRWDWETTRKKGAHDIILEHFANHQADVLIGTQMLAKGLDLPLVTLVGVILADVGLSFPDYRATERTFQVLTQVSGRAGRSPLGGKVILQSFQPDHYVITAAARHDYRGFYRQEIVHRRNLGYPPFSRLVRLEFRDTDEVRTERAAQALAEKIQSWIQQGNHRATDLIGPAPCFFTRTSGYYRWHLILRGPNPVEILQNKPLGDCRVEVDPPSLL